MSKNKVISNACNKKVLNTCLPLHFLYNQTPFFPFFLTFNQNPTFIVMAEFRNPQYSKPRHSSDQLPRSHKVVKAATAVTTGTSLLVLSGLVMAGTVIGLAVITPLLVIFSPVLVPAVMTASLLILGFLPPAGSGSLRWLCCCGSSGMWGETGEMVVNIYRRKVGLGLPVRGGKWKVK